LINQIAFNLDDKLLASASEDGTIEIVSGIDFSHITTIKTSAVSDLGVLCVNFSPNGDFIASCGAKPEEFVGIVQFWNISDFAQSYPEIRNGIILIEGFAFSPDGKIMASNGDAGLTLWNATTRAQIGASFGDASLDLSGGRQLLFSPDGTILFSLMENQILLWDVQTRQSFGQPLITHNDHIRSTSISADGTLFASSDALGIVNIWFVSPSKWQEIACYIAGRNFAEGEWAQYFPNDSYRISCPQWLAGE
jgi:WD40 repeat protein